MKESLLDEFMEISIKPKKAAQQRGDRFTSLMKRVSLKNTDDCLAPFFNRGLDEELQCLINISRAAELTVMDEGELPATSIARKIRQAITLNAGRKRSDKGKNKPKRLGQGCKAADPEKPNKPSGQKRFRGKCGMCGGRGHAARITSTTTGREMEMSLQTTKKTPGMAKIRNLAAHAKNLGSHCENAVPQSQATWRLKGS